MKKLNRKGFTLIELIIAMSILGIVLSIGYGILNGANKAINEQGKIFNGQTSINTVRTFLTKDLEQTKEFLGVFDKNGTLLEINNTKNELQELVNRTKVTDYEEYTYKIKINNTNNVASPIDIGYKVTLTKSGNLYKYDIDRIEKQGTTTISTIKLISNQLVNHEEIGSNINVPFTISMNSNKYHVAVGYEQNKKQNVYKFSASSRYF